MDDNKLMFAIIGSAFIIGSFIYFSDNKEVEYQKTEIIETIESKCISLESAQNHIGEDTCVIGKIDHIYTSNKGTVFFDYCKDYKNCPFTVVIFASDNSNFKDVSIYDGKTIEISGVIKTYKGQAEIILKNEEQISIID